MNKKILTAVWILLVIGIGVDIYVYSKHPTSENIVLSGGSYIEHTAYYDITASYASSTPLAYEVSPSADTAAVALMKKFVSDTIDRFKTDGKFTTLTPEDIKMLGYDEGRKQSLQIAYLSATSVNTISYIFTAYTETGGAHGNSLFHTFTFDTSTGKQVSLSDIFMPGTPYLEKLSTISRARLPDVIGDPTLTTFINDGTTSEEKNFEDFFFDTTEIVILFSPYQVAPYAAGPQTLRIPRSDLKDILKTEYR